MIPRIGATLGASAVERLPSMDLKEHLFEMQRRLKEEFSESWTIQDVADHFGVNHAFVAGWFSRTNRVPTYAMLQDLAKLAQYTEKEMVALNDSWFTWRFTRGAAAHLAPVILEEALPRLPPRARREVLDLLIAAEAESVRIRGR